MAVQSFAADATDLLEQRDTSILNAVFVDEHQIQEGERLQDVAAQYGISVATLFWTNQLGTSEVLAAGRMLKIANREGVVHQVGEGETVATIAAQYQVPTDAIRLFEANGLLGDAEPTVGQELFIPSGVAEYPAEVLSRVGANGVASWMAVSAATVREDQTNLREGPSRMHNRVGKLRAGRALELLARSENWAKVRSGETEGWVRQDLLILPVGAFERLPETTDYPPPPPIWVWPARGVLTSPFGWRSIPFRSFHNGIDIANGAWTPILAARAGVIIEAGWCRGYGYCVRMNHGEGTTTTYGHLIAQPPVRVGEQVEVGEVIGYMGSTYDRAGGGYSTGVHLHFTIMVNGQAVDPLRFLP
jgi:murein DD-endopeptidase MepM/ murein hydrolase activator NlpD